MTAIAVPSLLQGLILSILLPPLNLLVTPPAQTMMSDLQDLLRLLAVLVMLEGVGVLMLRRASCWFSPS